MNWLDGVKAILEKKAEKKIDINAANKYVRFAFLFVSLSRSQVVWSCVDRLLHAVCSFQGWTALRSAAGFGFVDIVGLVIAAGVDLNVQDKLVRTFFPSAFLSCCDMALLVH
jgi:hypothetical protein